MKTVEPSLMAPEMKFQIPVAEFLPHVTVGLIMWNFISGAITPVAMVIQKGPRTERR